MTEQKAGGKDTGRAVISVDKEHRLQRDNRRLKRDVRSLKEQLATDKELARLYKKLREEMTAPPKWLVEKNNKKDKAIATAPLSDPHFDEVVRPEAVEFCNAYNREIADMRLIKWAENVVKVGRDHFSGIYYDGIVVPLLGDMVPGTIHDELIETSEYTCFESVRYWAQQITAALIVIAEQYGKVHCPAVVGNHGRDGKKPRHKGRVQHNWDWLMYSLIQDYLELIKVPEITMQVSINPEVTWNAYGTVYRAMHGDDFKGGSGIAGALSPLMLGDHRTRKRSGEIGNPFDYLVLGHFHQEIQNGGLIVSPSLKGYDEYAYNKKFPFAPAKQIYWLTDPKWGKTLSAPIHVVGKEGWNEEPAIDHVLNW